MYDVFDILKERVLYFDIDFVIYIKKFFELFIFIGNYFGEFMNEFDEGDYIIEFVVVGFKNYVYEIFKDN